MQRYFVAKENMTDDSVWITGEDVKHLIRVMRMDKGDSIICCDNEGRTAQCVISDFNEEQVTATIEEWIHDPSELPVKVTIAQGLPKGDKLEYIVQKGTELGAFRFRPFQASRSIVKWDAKKAGKKAERLKKIAKEASEQSHRSAIPEIESIANLNQLIAESGTYDMKVIAYEEEAKQGEVAKLAESLNGLDRNSSLLVVIGPEGGLTEAEVNKLEEAGFIACSFGPRILRTETAPLYLLSVVSYHFELMR